MDNTIAGNPLYESSDIYPEQNLTMQFLRRDNNDYANSNTQYEYADGDTQYEYANSDTQYEYQSPCNYIPMPMWAYAACSSRTNADSANNKFFNGRSVGDFRMTGSDELVNIPGHYVPTPELQRVTQCDMRQTAQERGSAWQSYNISNKCLK